MDSTQPSPDLAYHQCRDREFLGVSVSGCQKLVSFARFQASGLTSGLKNSRPNHGKRHSALALSQSRPRSIHLQLHRSIAASRTRRPRGVFLQSQVEQAGVEVIAKALAIGLVSRAHRLAGRGCYNSNTDSI